MFIVIFITCLYIEHVINIKRLYIRMEAHAITYYFTASEIIK